MHFLSIFQSSELYRFGFGRRFLGLYLNMTDNLVAIYDFECLKPAKWSPKKLFEANQPLSVSYC